MPRAKRVTTKPGEKIRKAKEIPADMDLGQPDSEVKELARAHTPVSVGEPAQPNTNAAPSTQSPRTPGVSKLTDQQRDEIRALLSQPQPPSMRAVARQLDVTFAAVKYLVDKEAIDTGKLALVRQRSYERRLGKRLPVSERVKIYAEVARGDAAGSKASDQLRALERIEALEGIVTAREQRESESNQVHVGPLFVMPAAASPALDIELPSARRSQDES